MFFHKYCPFFKSFGKDRKVADFREKSGKKLNSDGFLDYLKGDLAACAAPVSV